MKLVTYLNLNGKLQSWINQCHHPVHLSLFESPIIMRNSMRKAPPEEKVTLWWVQECQAWLRLGWELTCHQELCSCYSSHSPWGWCRDDAGYCVEKSEVSALYWPPLRVRGVKENSEHVNLLQHKLSLGAADCHRAALQINMDDVAVCPTSDNVVPVFTIIVNIDPSLVVIQ